LVSFLYFVRQNRLAKIAEARIILTFHEPGQINGLRRNAKRPESLIDIVQEMVWRESGFILCEHSGIEFLGGLF
jgi:hypothetical protein